MYTILSHPPKPVVLSHITHSKSCSLKFSLIHILYITHIYHILYYYMYTIFSQLPRSGVPSHVKLKRQNLDPLFHSEFPPHFLWRVQTFMDTHILLYIRHVYPHIYLWIHICIHIYIHIHMCINI